MTERPRDVDPTASAPEPSGRSGQPSIHPLPPSKIAAHASQEQMRRRWAQIGARDSYRVTLYLGEALEADRLVAGLTRAQLIERMPVKIHPQTVATYENGIRSMTLERFLEICAGLGVSAPGMLQQAMERAGAVVGDRVADERITDRSRRLAAKQADKLQAMADQLRGIADELRPGGASMAECSRQDCSDGQIQTPSSSGAGGSYPCPDPVHRSDAEQANDD